MEDDVRELFDFGSDLFTPLDDVSTLDWPSALEYGRPKHEADDGAVTVIELTHADASTQAKIEQRKPIKNRGRERLKREMEELRQRAKELEQELQTLQVAKSSDRSDSSSHALPLVRSCPWQSAVETERVKRQRSEQENERLRRTLETQLQVATGLSAYLSSRVGGGSGGGGAPDALADVVTHIPPLFFSSFNFVTTQLLRDIDRAYAVTDRLFSRSAWTSYPDERVFESSVKTRRYKGEDQLYIELNDTAYRPHSYERVVDAVWEATQSVYGRQQRTTDVGISTDDTFAARYRRSGLTRRGEAKDLVVTSVNKRFVEPDRTVQIWRTCISPALHDSDMPLQALSDETGWVIVTRVPEGFPTRRSGTAFFQATSHLVPLWFEDDVADASVRTQLTIGEFTNVVLSATEADVVSFEDLFQRLLLDARDGGDSKHQGHIDQSQAWSAQV